MTKVSVILTTYNSAKFLLQTIQSVLEQNEINKIFELEFIIVDDCSTDNTTEILRSLNLPFISTKSNSGGPNKGRNIALKIATGDYICFIDHDDVWAKRKIELQLKAISISNASIAGTGYSVINKYTKKNSNICDDNEQIKFYDKNVPFLKFLKGEKNNQVRYFYFSALMIHSSLKNILFEEEYGMFDFDYQLKLFENQRAASITTNLMKRYVYDSNLSLNENYRKLNYEFSVTTLHKYKDKYSSLVSKGIKRINGSMARYYYLMGNMKKSRFYFRKSSFNLITILYYITSFGLSKIIKRFFRVFG